ncbi:protein GREB1 [Lates japonicus]|uniref:Protein GREB1 n=1 Tax=Lates japonicus TaxID=270547 RepID=A0AAD3MX99_LATJO|nr:protein GREB1 [Lates japonicus]
MRTHRAHSARWRRSAATGIIVAPCMRRCTAPPAEVRPESVQSLRVSSLQARPLRPLTSRSLPHPPVHSTITNATSTPTPPPLSFKKRKKEKTNSGSATPQQQLGIRLSSPKSPQAQQQAPVRESMRLHRVMHCCSKKSTQQPRTFSTPAGGPDITTSALYRRESPHPHGSSSRPDSRMSDCNASPADRVIKCRHAKILHGQGSKKEARPGYDPRSLHRLSCCDGSQRGWYGSEKWLYAHSLCYATTTTAGWLSLPLAPLNKLTSSPDSGLGLVDDQLGRSGMLKHPYPPSSFLALQTTVHPHQPLADPLASTFPDVDLYHEGRYFGVSELLSRLRSGSIPLMRYDSSFDMASALEEAPDSSSTESAAPPPQTHLQQDTWRLYNLLTAAHDVLPCSHMVLWIPSLALARRARRLSRVGRQLGLEEFEIILNQQALNNGQTFIDQIKGLPSVIQSTAQSCPDSGALDPSPPKAPPLQMCRKGPWTPYSLPHNHRLNFSPIRLALSSIILNLHHHKPTSNSKLFSGQPTYSCSHNPKIHHYLKPIPNLTLKHFPPWQQLIPLPGANPTPQTQSASPARSVANTPNPPPPWHPLSPGLLSSTQAAPWGAG